MSPNAVDPSEELFGEPTAEDTPSDDGGGKRYHLAPTYLSHMTFDADDLAAFAEQLKSAQKSAKKRYGVASLVRRLHSALHPVCFPGG